MFGVCKALASRCGCEPWVTRLTAIIAGVFFTLPALISYVLLGLFMKETQLRTRGFFSGLAVLFREWSDKFSRPERDSYHSDGYNGGYR